MRARRPAPLALLALVAAGVFAPSRASAQDAAVDAYFQGVADHFDVPTDEVRVLSEWQIRPEEVPVVLYLAGRAGVSTDALIALKRGGRSWSELAGRYDVRASTFHVPLEGQKGSLSATYEKFDAAPPSAWDGITLQDSELVHLVNLKVLSDYLRVPPGRVLQERDRSGSWVGAFGALVRG